MPCIALHYIALHCSVLYCIAWMSLVSFLVSILKLAPSFRAQLSIRSSSAEVSGLGSGLDSEPGSKLPFAKHVDQIELRGGLWSRS